MYKVISKKGITLDTCSSLDQAMDLAKLIGIFVTIKGPDFEVCGVFGVDNVEDGLCPDGIEYTWKKRRI